MQGIDASREMKRALDTLYQLRDTAHASPEVAANCALGELFVASTALLHQDLQRIREALAGLERVEMTIRDRIASARPDEEARPYHDGP